MARKAGDRSRHDETAGGGGQDVRRAKGRPQATGDAVGREALVEATIELLKTKSHHEITRSEIARFAGVDSALIRYYFGSVEHLFAEVTVRIIRDFQAALDNMPDGLSPADRLRERIRRTLQLHGQYPNHQALVTDLFFGKERKIERDTWRALVGRSLDQLDAVVQEGFEAGEFRRIEHRYLHLAILGACEFFVSYEGLLTDMFGFDKPTEQRKEEFVAALSDLLLKGLRSDG